MSVFWNHDTNLVRPQNKITKTFGKRHEVLGKIFAAGRAP